MMGEGWARPRRAGRAIQSPAEIEALFQRAPFGYTATSIDNQPFLHVGLFWYDPAAQRLFFHTARDGRTRDNVLANPRVCFGIAEIGRLPPPPTALGFPQAASILLAFC